MKINHYKLIPVADVQLDKHEAEYLSKEGIPVSESGTIHLRSSDAADLIMSLSTIVPQNKQLITTLTQIKQRITLMNELVNNRPPEPEPTHD